MDRRGFLMAAGGTVALGASGATGWAVRGGAPGVSDRSSRERGDATGLGMGGAGAYGISRIIYSVPVAEPLVALTFDDGPDPEFTPRVLEILATFGLKATFMVMGYNAMHHPALLNEVVAAGHEIGNHTWTHRDFSTLDPAETAYEIRRGREVIEELTTRKVQYFRPPRGEMSGVAVRLVAEEGNDLLMWSVTGSVHGREHPTEVNAFVLSHLKPGAIVDYHDGIGRGTFDRTNAGARSLIARRNAEIRGLPKLLDESLARGFQYLRVSDLLSHAVPGRISSLAPDQTANADADEPTVTNPPDATAPPPT
jgi:peptidoglycan/xylan/chitin deacetylase (PgdA/CDA1 family)